MNHYCTYFDRNFLIQGMALAGSLHVHDAESTLWILCLDDFTRSFIEDLADPRLRAVSLEALERADPELARARNDRSLIEYYFTLSPCWPHFLLENHPEIDRVTYLDADLFFFGSPRAIFDEMGQRSVLVTEHRYPAHLNHHLRCGRFNVGILAFRNDSHGRHCLSMWRKQCLRWCRDQVEDGKYADQGYLDGWPELLGDHLCILTRPGVNLAPWNWSAHRITRHGGALRVDDHPLELFHFARFRPQTGEFFFQSGQLEYGIMPWRVRQQVYGTYWNALKRAREQVRAHRPVFDFPKSRLRSWHGFWRALGPRVVFGSDWLRIGPFFISGRLGFGRFSGRLLSFARSVKERQRQETTAVDTALSSSTSDTPL